MDERSTDVIEGWHAHVYFDADTREAAQSMHQGDGAVFPEAQIGRFHEKPVGPHPMWSFQIAFGPESFGKIVPWLGLNRGVLDVFVHPYTGDDRADHSDHVMFLGRSYALDLSIFD